VKILGIDPGSIATGYGLIVPGGIRPRVLECGVISPRPGASFPEKLHQIFTDLRALLERTGPDVVAVESLFYGANVKSLTVIAQVRGVILLAGAIRELPVAEYSPREIKMAVAGNGAASKEQVRSMVHATTDVEGKVGSLDAADGIAVALCHLGREVAVS
jgi:crossover junction endodeoxyribonuclease RuvC